MKAGVEKKAVMEKETGVTKKARVRKKTGVGKKAGVRKKTGVGKKARVRKETVVCYVRVKTAEWMGECRTGLLEKRPPIIAADPPRP
ncbi:hypothetical protein Pmani_020040 [Petrolisthes manimaculis]|uniref:Uncharacterized protein n=1 Tax=Petrolisthes manimaculis TaxID=1843537 RepID=A0AAE1U6T6_9EUCA|nr:hypothetical protein Pmani_020040 [Petrolisthes manimaculis]